MWEAQGAQAEGQQEQDLYKLATVDRNLESLLKEQGLLKRLSSEVPALNWEGTYEA
jgi:hypothetical protein